MLIGSFRDFALIPISLVAALIDVIFKGKREGDLFYKVLRWSWHSEEMIDVYSPIKHETDELKINPNYTVDAVIARLEGVPVPFSELETRLKKVIKQARWNQSNGSTHGTFKWQGSNDGTSYSDIGGTFTLGGATVQVHASRWWIGP